MAATPEFHLRRFGDLTPGELYGLLRLRSEVFVVEQACIYQDIDGLDPYCLHLLAGHAGETAAYARLIPPGRVHPTRGAVGRVATAKAVRGRGWGRAVVRAALDACAREWPAAGLQLHAQSHLQAFYASLGFVSSGPEFAEDGIPHRLMLRPVG